MNPTVDPTSYLSDPSLISAQNNAQNAQQTATQDTSAAMTLPDLLKQTLNAKFSDNNPLVATQTGQLKDYLNTLTQAPLDYTAKSAGGNSDVVYSPLDFANLVQGRRAAALAPLAGTNFLLGQSTGGIQNIIDSSSRAAQAQAAIDQGNATAAENSFQHLLALMQAKTQAAQQQQTFNEGVREYNNPQPSKSGGSDTGISGDSLTTLLSALGLGGNPIPHSFQQIAPITNQKGGTQFDQGTLDAATAANLYALLGGTGNGQ